MKLQYLIFLLFILSINCTDNSTCPDTGKIPEISEVTKLNIHLNLENATNTFSMIKGGLGIIGKESIEFIFTLYQDSAVAVVENLTENLWSLSVLFYDSNDSIIAYGDLDVDVKVNMNPDLFVDYDPDFKWNAIMPLRDEVEEFIYTLILDTIYSWWGNLPDLSNRYIVLPDSSQFNNVMNKIDEDIFETLPNLKLSTLLNYYAINYESRELSLSNTHTPHIFAEIPDPWWNLDFDKFYEQYPDAHEILLFTRIGFSPSFSQAIVYITEAQYQLGAYGYVVYIEKRKTYQIKKIIGMWVS